MARTPVKSFGEEPGREWVLVRIQRCASGGRVQETRSVRVWGVPMVAVSDTVENALDTLTKPQPDEAPVRRRRRG